MRKPIVGYIVVDNGGVKGYASDGPKGILWYTNRATLFVTREAAKKAIATTKAHADKQGYKWGIEAWWIVRVVKA